MPPLVRPLAPWLQLRPGVDSTFRSEAVRQRLHPTRESYPGHKVRTAGPPQLHARDDDSFSTAICRHGPKAGRSSFQACLSALSLPALGSEQRLVSYRAWAVLACRELPSWITATLPTKDPRKHRPPCLMERSGPTQEMPSRVKGV